MSDDKHDSLKSIEQVLLHGFLDDSLDEEEMQRLERAIKLAAEVLADVEAAPDTGPLKRDLNDNESMLAWAVDYLGDVIVGLKGVLRASQAASAKATPEQATPAMCRAVRTILDAYTAKMVWERMLMASRTDGRT